MLRDASTASPKPYSFSRVQLAWWTSIVLASFISTILVQKQMLTLWDSTLYLLGISGTTMAAGKIIDTSDQRNPDITRHQDSKSDNFFLDILSDENGVSIHRFQIVVFNLVFGIWFITYVLKHLNVGIDMNHGISVIPDFSSNNLVLLGLSSATYVGLKTTENSVNEPSKPGSFITDEGKSDAAIPKG